MRLKDEALDRDVLRHYEGMRDDIVHFTETWLSLEQLMYEFGIEYQTSQDSLLWLGSSQHALDALMNLITIIKNADRPLTLHWERFARDTVKSLDRINGQIGMTLDDTLRS